MNTILNWFRQNIFSSILALFFVVLLVSPEAKTFFMRQIASTGLLNPKVKEVSVDQTTVESENLSPKINFYLKDEKQNILNTAEMEGKVVFINFWASWCPPCRAEFPSIQKFYDQYKTQENLVFLTINLDDDPAAGKNYLTKENFTVPFLTTENEIPTEYFRGSLPTTLLLDKKGNIRMNHAGMADYSSSGFYSQVDQLLNE